MMKSMHKFFAALALLLFANSAFAQCDVTVEVGDNLTFSVGSSMEMPADCAEITLTIKHTGTLPAAAMGHNWVLTKTADFQPVAQAGLGAGVANNYLPSDDPRIIAATKLIGGGESDTITFSTEGMEAGGDYTFFCSFPGHWAVMKGTFALN